MVVQELAKGLWRSALPHPAWKPEFDRPGGWGQVVASLYAELDAAIVLLDPLLPVDGADRERFWKALDRDVAAAARPLVVHVGCVDHGRSADEVAARYRGHGVKVTVLGDASLQGRVSCRLDASIGERYLPAGLRSLPIAGLSPGERGVFLDPWRAAYFADAVIGVGDGRLRVAPPTWGIKTPEGRALYDRSFRSDIRKIFDLAPDIVIPSHGAPALTGGRAALEEALTSPPWGE